MFQARHVGGTLKKAQGIGDSGWIEFRGWRCAKGSPQGGSKNMSAGSRISDSLETLSVEVTVCMNDFSGTDQRSDLRSAHGGSSFDLFGLFCSVLFVWLVGRWQLHFRRPQATLVSIGAGDFGPQSHRLRISPHLLGTRTGSLRALLVLC